MKYLSKHLPAILLLLLVGAGCKSFFGRNKTVIVEPTPEIIRTSPSPTAAETPISNSDSGSSVPGSGSQVPGTVSGGVLNGKATSLPKPAYPPAAKAVNAAGAVNVQVSVDEKGNVTSANAVSGHPLLRASAVQAAREAKFSPTMLGGKPVKVTGVIVYNFTP
jgi:TonB family protein